MPSSFNDLRVWQDAMKLSVAVYHQMARFPKHELYGLAQQVPRAAVSVASNIAEGKGRGSDRDRGHFLFQARGSLLELQTQALIAEQLEYLGRDEASVLEDISNGVGRALNGLINSLREKPADQRGRRPTTQDQRL